MEQIYGAGRLLAKAVIFALELLLVGLAYQLGKWQGIGVVGRKPDLEPRIFGVGKRIHVDADEDGIGSAVCHGKTRRQIQFFLSASGLLQQ